MGVVAPGEKKFKKVGFVDFGGGGGGILCWALRLLALTL